MNTMPPPRAVRPRVLLILLLVLFFYGTQVYAQTTGSAPEPAVYLNFDEGSGTYALDSSGHGNAATLHNVSRVDSGGCSQALLFFRAGSYAAIPFRTLNHPSKEIT
jgi:hypothetical protein